MALIDELKERLTAVSNEMDRLEAQGREIDLLWKEQERLFGDLDTAILALDPSDPPNMLDDDDDDLDTAIAALEPAPDVSVKDIEPVAVTIEAPAQPPSAELRSVTPATEEESWDQIEIPPGFTKWEGGECPVPHGTIVDLICRDPNVRVGQTNQVFAHMISWANEGDPAYNIIAYRIISQPADYSEEEIRRIGEAEDAVDATLAGSVLADPELLAAIERANATIAQATYQDEPALGEAPAAAYVGLQDPELDAEFDAMKQREHAERKKHFSIFGHRKLEDA